jgi:hypothetical protein
VTSGANEAGAISTLGAGKTGQNSLITVKIWGVPSLISYPARPIQGGKLDRAPKKIGLWYAQPNYNGGRAVVHCPSGTMWNRHDGRLSDKKVTTAGATLSLVIVADHVEAVRRVVLPGRKVAGAIQGLRPWRMVAAVARPMRR